MGLSALKHSIRLTTVVGLGFVGAFLSSCSHQSTVTPPSTTVPSSNLQPAPVFVSHVTIYELARGRNVADADDNGLNPVGIDLKPDTRDPAREALEALARSKRTPLPAGTSLLGISIDNATGLATVNFSHQFKDNFTGGDTREAQVLNSVLETLGQFPNVQNVQFLVEGAKIDSLGGTQDLSSPLPAVRDAKVAAASG